ncbi:MAG: hypothetical protein AAF713_17305 [Pseudomonadota bacterium]
MPGQTDDALREHLAGSAPVADDRKRVTPLRAVPDPGPGENRILGGNLGEDDDDLLGPDDYDRAAPAAFSDGRVEPEPPSSGQKSNQETLQEERLAQMVEIRAMLDDLQRSRGKGEPGGPPALPEPEGGSADRPLSRRGKNRELDEVDPLREKLANRPAKAEGGKKPPGDTRKSLMKRHQKRAKQRKIADARKGPSAFSTGLMLIVMIAAVMTGVYVLHPQIIERLPGTEAAMRDYVASIDNLRGSVAESYSGLIAWVGERLENL